MRARLRYVDAHCNVPAMLAAVRMTSLAQYSAQLVPPAPAPLLVGCVAVASDTATRSATLALGAEEGGVAVRQACGIHPLYAREWSPSCAAALCEAMQHPCVAAWGELGLDYHDFGPSANYATREEQLPVCEAQLKLAVQHGKSILLHTREAEADTLALLRAHVPREWPIHAHCFTDSPNFARTLLSEFSNLYISFAGNVTFKNAHQLREVLSLTPLNRLMAESDSPFLAPVPHRGKPSHSVHVADTLTFMAHVLDCPLEKVFEHTTANASRFYGLQLEPAM